MAINNALGEVERSGNLPVPLHLRNAPTKLMSELDYGKNYKYAHDYPGHFVRQQFLPDGLEGSHFWHSADNEQEQRQKALYDSRWGNSNDNNKK